MYGHYTELGQHSYHSRKIYLYGTYNLVQYQTNLEEVEEGEQEEEVEVEEDRYIIRLVSENNLSRII